MAQNLKNEVILITGAAGSIGREFTMGLAHRNPKQLILVDVAETALHSLTLQLKDIAPDLDVVYFIDSVCNQSFVKYLFSEYAITTVIHAAAYKHVSMVETNVCAAIHTNVWGAKLILDLSIQQQVKRFIFISTDKAVSPQNVMGRTKKLFEDYALQIQEQHRQVDISILRLCNVYGSSGSVVPLFKERIANNQPLIIRGKNATRAFVQPESLLEMLEVLIDDDAQGLYIPHQYELLTVEEVAHRVLEFCSMESKDYPMVYESLFDSEKEHEELKASTEIESDEPLGPLVFLTKAEKTKLDLNLMEQCLLAAKNYKAEEALKLLVTLTR